MPLWFSLIWGITTATLIVILVPYWADIFKIDISGKVILISFPILFVVSFLYNLFAPEKLWTITFIATLAIGTLSCGVHWIRVLIRKWKK